MISGAFQSRATLLQPDELTNQLIRRWRDNSTAAVKPVRSASRGSADAARSPCRQRRL